MGISVVGSYPHYIAVSDDLGARRFDIGSVAWSALPDSATRWAANRYFLDSKMKARDKFFWATDPKLARPGSWFFQEVNYLRSKGVSLPTQRAWLP